MRRVNGRAGDQTKSRQASKQEEAGVFPDGPKDQKEGDQGQQEAKVRKEVWDAVAERGSFPPVGQEAEPQSHSEGSGQNIGADLEEKGSPHHKGVGESKRQSVSEH